MLAAVNDVPLSGLGLQETISAVRKVTMGGGAALTLSLKRAASAGEGGGGVGPEQCSEVMSACAAAGVYATLLTAPLPVAGALAAELLVLPGSPQHSVEGSLVTSTITVAVSTTELALHNVVVSRDSSELVYRQLARVDYTAYMPALSLDIWPIGYMSYAISTLHSAPLAGDLSIVLTVLTIQIDGGLSTRPVEVSRITSVVLLLSGADKDVRWRMAAPPVHSSHFPRCLLVSPDGGKLAVCEHLAGSNSTSSADSKDAVGCTLHCTHVIDLAEPLLEAAFLDADTIRITTRTVQGACTTLGEALHGPSMPPRALPRDPFVYLVRTCSVCRALVAARLCWIFA